MSAKQQAIRDIKESYGKSFLAFHKELNKPIRDLVKKYLKQQRESK